MEDKTVLSQINRTLAVSHHLKENNFKTALQKHLLNCSNTLSKDNNS